MLASTFSDYTPITSVSMPKIKYAHTVTPSPYSYNGAKGMGEGAALRCTPSVLRFRMRYGKMASSSMTPTTTRAPCMSRFRSSGAGRDQSQMIKVAARMKELVGHEGRDKTTV